MGQKKWLFCPNVNPGVRLLYCAAQAPAGKLVSRHGIGTARQGAQTGHGRAHSGITYLIYKIYLVMYIII